MHLKFKAIALAIALSAATGTVAAQDFAFHWNPRTGDVWVDNQLNDINRYGYRYREPFIDEMTRYYGAPRDLVSDLLVNQRWAPGDVYYACALARAAGRPCADVVDEWRRSNGQGWGVVAQRLGIKPGSAEFHRLKKGFVPTYDRWARPITLDRDLVADFPGRGKGPKGTDADFARGKSGDAIDRSSRGRDPSSKGRDVKGHAGAKGKAARTGKPDHAGNKGPSGQGKAAKAGTGKGNAGKAKGGGKGKANADGKGKG